MFPIFLSFEKAIKEAGFSDKEIETVRKYFNKDD